MKMGAVIGLPVPTSHDQEYNRVFGPAYGEAISSANGEVRWIPLGGTAEEVRELATGCDGFVLPGSPADVDPTLYGQRTEPGTAVADKAREACDLRLLDHAAEFGKPVLAICYGLQLLNTWRGGTLVQHLSPLPVDHAAKAGAGVAHSVLVQSRSLLAGLLSQAEAPAMGEFRQLPVNSSHHQAVDGIGDAFTVVARAMHDGAVEAVEGRLGRAAMVGVQWHPERSVATSAASRALFHWLVAEAEDARAEAGGERASAGVR